MKILELDLPFKFDMFTKGAGNCFFHALMQQFRRPELNVRGYWTHQALRSAICQFAVADNNNAAKEILRMKWDNRAVVAGTLYWDNIIQEMEKVGVFAENPLIQVAGYFLDRDILIVSPKVTAENPYLFLQLGNPSYPPILLANAGDHYQSLLPIHASKSTVPKKTTAPTTTAEAMTAPATTSRVGKRRNQADNNTSTPQKITAPATTSRRNQHVEVLLGGIRDVIQHGDSLTNSLKEENNMLKRENRTLRKELARFRKEKLMKRLNTSLVEWGDTCDDDSILSSQE